MKADIGGVDEIAIWVLGEERCFFLPAPASLGLGFRGLSYLDVLFFAVEVVC